MNCEEYRSIVTDHADGRLGGAESASAQAHLATCEECAALRREQEAVSKLLRRRAPHHRTPPEVRGQVLAALQGEHATKAPVERLFRRPLVRRAVLTGAAAAALILAVLSLTRTAEPDLLAVLARDVRAADAGSVSFALHSDDFERIRRFYADSPRIDFSNPVADLTPLGFRPVGADISRIADVDTSLTLYRSADGRVVCRRFRAGAIPLPDGGEDIDGAIYHTVDGITVRVERIGDTICVMASSMPRAELVRLFAVGHHH